jgi:hypothetical protein
MKSLFFWGFQSWRDRSGISESDDFLLPRSHESSAMTCSGVLKHSFSFIDAWADAWAKTTDGQVSVRR